MKPLATRKSDAVAALGEERLIGEIRRWLGNATPAAPHGIGDDCAVLPAAKGMQAITVDPVIYGRHFDDRIPPEAVGAKLLKRNLSDLAAMGAQPTAAVVALTLDPMTRLRWLEGFYRGLAACARKYQVPVVGGDIAQASGTIAASLTLLGRTTGPRMLLRSGARIGDWIYVTGSLGGSICGHHHRFEPRLAEGKWLAGRAEVKSLIDISDGPAKDLRALAPANAEPALDPAALPVSPDAIRLSRRTGRTALDHALSDGEDYELLFTVDSHADCTGFERAWRRRFSCPLARIGRFVRAGKRPQGTINLSQYRGYEHLR